MIRILDADPAAMPVWERLVQVDGDLIAPTLLPYEVANVLPKQRRVTTELAGLRLDRCRRLPIELHGDARLHSRALELAHDRQLPTMYDAHYVALAERFRVPLWTCDRPLAAALSDGLPEVYLVP